MCMCMCMICSSYEKQRSTLCGSNMILNSVFPIAWMQQLERRLYAYLLTLPIQVVVLLMIAREFFSTSAL